MDSVLSRQTVLMARLVTFLALAFLGAHACWADSIKAASENKSVSPAALDDLELADLGIDPNLFLFTGNTMNEYNGVYQVEIIGADIDPSKKKSLDGVTTQQVLLTVGDGGGGGSQSSVPEPSSKMLLASGLFTILAWQAWRGLFSTPLTRSSTSNRQAIR